MLSKIIFHRHFLLVCALVAFLAGGVATAIDNPCFSSAKKEDGLKCPSDFGAWFNFILPHAIGPLLCFVIGIWCFFGYFLTCVCRYCCGCCGSSKTRPGAGCWGGSEMDDAYQEEDLWDAYNKTGVLVVKIFTVVLGVLAVIAVILAFVGVGKVQEFPQALTDGAIRLANYFLDIIQRILDGFNSENPAFADAKKQLTDIRGQTDNIKDYMKKITERIDPVVAPMIGLCVPLVFVALASIMGVVAALARIRTLLPLLAILFLILTGVPTGILGLASGFAAIPFNVWCTEVDAWKAREGGLFKDYILPEFCEKKIDFKGLRDKMTTESGSLSNRTCSDLSSQCDASTTYSGSGSVFFTCDTSPTCSTTQQLVDFLGNVKVKDGAPDACAGGCTLQQCATQCSGTLKTSAADIWNGANDANNAVKAITDVLDNYLSCDKILDEVLAAFPICETVHAGLSLLYAGAAMGITVNLLMPICMFLGQKRFFPSTAWNREGTSSTEQAEMSLMGKLGFGGAAKQGAVEPEL